MSDEVRTVYGDGRISVEVSASEVVIRHGADAIDLSRAAFREVMLGYERLLQQEDENP